jgi:hypothetical protein
MKKLSPLFRFALLNLILLTSISVISCQDDHLWQTNQEALIEARSSVETTHQIIVSVQEVVDITSEVLSAEGISIEGTNGSAKECPPSLDRQYIKDTSHYDSTIYAGAISLAYGAGNNCTDKGTKREGTINNLFTYVINYRDNVSSSVRQSISFHNFKRNKIQLNGIIRATGATGFSDSLEIRAATMTYENGQFINWGGMLSNQQINSDGVINGARITTGIDAANTRILTGKIHSSTVDGKFFTGNIVKAIRCNYECSGLNSLTPVSGIVEIDFDGKRVILDYGDGRCDTNYTVSINNNVRSYSF